MGERDKYRMFTKVACPQCGKAFPVRILELKGEIRYSVKCKACGKVSEVSVSDNI